MSAQTTDQIADKFGVSNNEAKRIARRRAARRGKHDYVAPKRGVPVANLNKKAKKG